MSTQRPPAPVKLLEHEPFRPASPEERYRLLEAACEMAAEQLRFCFPGVTTPRDNQAPLPASSRAIIRRLARESRERRRGRPNRDDGEQRP